MTTARFKSLKKEIASLSPEELAMLRRWFADFDAAESDRQTEREAASGRLGHLHIAEVERRLAELERGQAAEEPADRILAEARKKSR